MQLFLDIVRRLLRYRPKRLVRPWALSAPILVLVVALPLLRPLRYPLQVSDEERARLATMQAIVEQGTLYIDGTDFTTIRNKIEVKDRWYSDQPPTMSVLLSAPYWVMHRNGLTLRRDGLKVTYLLTVLGSAIPAACAAGLIYRMGRLFELRRHWRALLAAAAVLGTGLISYATVLNAHVPAAALVLCAAACLVHVTISNKRVIGPLWLFVAGLCAALAATLDPAAIPFVFLMLVVAASIRWRIWTRVGGVAAYAVGAALPIALHAALTVPVTGNFWHGLTFKPPAPDVAIVAAAVDAAPRAPDAPSSFDEESPAASPGLPRRLFSTLFGTHGMFSHFPVLLLGIIGVGMVMHRHWPTAAKVLGSATLAGGLLLIVIYATGRREWKDWRDAMFANRWCLVFAPLVLFWAGAWLRRSHRATTWTVAGVLLTFSIAVSVVGAVSGPLPREGFDQYTVAAAWVRLIHPPSAASAPQMLAGP